MDEPFSALDPITREKLQDEMLKLQEELKKTIVFVTHDMDEALKLADKIAVVKDGKILQFDTPEEILKNPKNEFVEFFIGKERLWKTPEMLLAKDIMKKKVAKISLEGTLSRAIEIMKEKDTTMVVVVDKVKDKPQEILGVVTPKILRISEQKKHPGTYKIKDIMRKEFVTVSETTNMVEVLGIMSEKDFRSIPVTDKENKVVGVITPTSLLNIIHEISPSSEKEEA
jgi:osmoprotectant transport system ATP-binding protein